MRDFSFTSEEGVQKSHQEIFQKLMQMVHSDTVLADCVCPPPLKLNVFFFVVKAPMSFREWEVFTSNRGWCKTIFSSS